MVVADPEASLLTACANGYGKRTTFGPSGAAEEAEAEGEGESTSSSNRYRTQNRGGKGVRDIKTTERNGPVIGIARVTDDDEVFMMTRRGKLQRIAASDISVIGRNTQGVRIMSLDDDDNLAAVVRVDPEDGLDGIAHQWQPIFVKHSETGRPALYVSHLISSQIEGMDRDESEVVLEKLIAIAEDPALVYEHVWRDGDLVMWDNRCSTHARTDFPAGETRLLRRCTLEGGPMIAAA